MVEFVYNEAMEHVSILSKNDPWFDQLHQLYLKSFPLVERRDMDLMIKKAKEGLVKIDAWIKQDTFVGLTIVSKGNRFDLFDYLAIETDQQRKGYGSTILKKILNRYSNQGLFLEIEFPNPSSDQYILQTKRYAFYINNGLIDSHMVVNLYRVNYLILTNGPPISFDDYVHTYIHAYGLSFTQMLDPIYIGSTITKKGLNHETER